MINLKNPRELHA